MSDFLPELAGDAVLKASEPVSENAQEVKGIDYSKPESRNAHAKDIIAGMRTMGFQASSLAKACDIIDDMRSWRGKHISELEDRSSI